MAEEKNWNNIRCKCCGTQKKRLFMMQPALDKDDVYCRECKVKEMENRSKNK